MHVPPTSQQLPPPIDRRGATENDPLWESARDFEAALAAELFAYAGLDDAVSGETGFAGSAFSRLVVESYAESFVDSGGFGLTEKIYRKLNEAQR